MPKLKAGVYHSYVADKIKEKCCNPCKDIVKRVDIREILYNYNIPVFLHNQFLKEMEKSGLIKIINKQNIKILVEK